MEKHLKKKGKRKIGQRKLKITKALFEMKWRIKICKCKCVNCIVRRLFYRHRLVMRIVTNKNGDKNISIFDKNTMTYYDWTVWAHNQETWTAIDGAQCEEFKLGTLWKTKNTTYH